MANNKKSIYKKSRRYNFSILENDKEFLKGKQRRVAATKQRGKLSNYGAHLYEKQKVKLMYGVNERQFKNTFNKASKLQGATGFNFLKLLETRLDNVLFRSGMFNTRKASRQFVSHGHIKVNGKKMNIPSYQVKIKDVIKINPKMEKNAQIIAQKQSGQMHRKDFVKFNEKDLSLTLERFPEREELNHNINEALIVEFYNK